MSNLTVRTLALALGLTLGAAGGAAQSGAPKDQAKPAPAEKAPAAKPPSVTQPAATAQPAAGGGAVVFVDPSTRQIRQPSASEIGTLSPASTQDVAVTNSTPAPVLIQGPNGAVGAILGPEHANYMVVTRTPEGKLAAECVTGDKAAAERVGRSAPAADSKNQKPQSPGPAN